MAEWEAAKTSGHRYDTAAGRSSAADLGTGLEQLSGDHSQGPAPTSAEGKG